MMMIMKISSMKKMMGMYMLDKSKAMMMVDREMKIDPLMKKQKILNSSMIMTKRISLKKKNRKR